MCGEKSTFFLQTLMTFIKLVPPATRVLCFANNFNFRAYSFITSILTIKVYIFFKQKKLKVLPPHTRTSKFKCVSKVHMHMKTTPIRHCCAHLINGNHFRTFVH